MKTALYTVEEFEKVYKELGFKEKELDKCKNIKPGFRSIIEEERDYLFARIKFNLDALDVDNLASLFLGIKKDEVYFIINNDANNEIRTLYNETIARCSGEEPDKERFLSMFFRLAVFYDGEYCEEAYSRINDLEKKIIKGDVEENFNEDLNKIKGYLLSAKGYYDHMIDVFEAITDNVYGLFDETKLDSINKTKGKVAGLKEEVNAMVDLLSQLQGSYQSYIDNKMNDTMKLLTIITLIFMPITIIVGWYGMNFAEMPELRWDYGYVYVIILSIALSAIAIYVAKKNKWF